MHVACILSPQFISHCQILRNDTSPPGLKCTCVKDISYTLCILCAWVASYVCELQDGMGRWSVLLLVFGPRRRCHRCRNYSSPLCCFFLWLQNLVSYLQGNRDADLSWFNMCFWIYKLVNYIQRKTYISLGIL